MGIALEDRQAVVMGAYAACQHIVAVEHQVMGGNRRRHVVTGFAYELHRVGGGDSFASGLVYGFMEFNDAKQAVANSGKDIPIESICVGVRGNLIER